MAHSLPIYQDHGKSFAADNCGPLIRGVETGDVRLAALVHGHYPGRKLPRGALPGVKTVGFWDAVCDQDWGLGWHRNEGIELTLLESGHLDFAVDSEVYQLKPDDLTVTRPWQRHRVGDPYVAAGRLHWLILDVGVRRPDQPWRWPSWIVLTKSDRDELTNVLRHNEQHVWQATPELRQCFRRIASAIETDCEGSHVSRLTVLLNELFLLVLEMLCGQEIKLDTSLSGTLRTVELFLADLRHNPEHLAPEWTVRGMARRCGLGVTQFSGHCKRLTNMTPLQYLNHFRLESAAHLLLTRPDLEVTKVALACGFSSGQYFATTFRRQFGCTPRAYRTCNGHRPFA